MAQRYYWDLSRRCLPTLDSATARVRILPEVPFTISPSAGGFRIFGPFTRGVYTVILEPGLSTVDGGRLNSTYETRVVVPPQSPSVRILAKGRYLPKSAWHALAVEHRNVDALDLTVRRARPENLVFWMSDDESEQLDARTSDLVAVRRFEVTAASDEKKLTLLDVASILPEPGKGLLQITVESGEARDTVRLLVTNLLLVAKRASPPPAAEGPAAGGTIRVWALDLERLEPVPGVEMSLVRRSGTVLAGCTTSADGGCTLSPKPTGPDREPPFAIVARTEDDLAYLKFADVGIEELLGLVSGTLQAVSLP